MNRLLPILVPLALTSCVVHLHVHEAPKLDPEQAETSSTPSSEVSAGAPTRAVAGVVLDEKGDPVRARVAAVGSSGSYAMGTADNGHFDLSHIRYPVFALHASTEDRVAVLPRMTAGGEGIELVLRPGAAITIELTGEKDIRCAILQHGDTIENFTLHPGKPARVVVPPGETIVQVYDGDGVREERTVRADVGRRTEVDFGPLGKDG